MDGTEFDIERPRLMALATRILGSEADADDVLQEAWLRLSGTGTIDDLPAWLTTVVTRLCLDHLRRRRTRSAIEPGLPGEHGAVDLEADVLLAERTGDALHVVLEALAPAERAAWREQGLRVGFTNGCFDILHPGHVKVLTAARGGDLATLLSLLAPDVIMRADPVGQSMGTEPTYEGPEAVAGRFNGSRGALPVTIDGELGAAWIQAGSPRVAFVFHLDETGRINEVELIADPDVLATLDIVRVRGASKD